MRYVFSGRLGAQAAPVALAQDDRLWPVNYGMEQVVTNRASGGYVCFSFIILSNVTSICT